MSDRLVLCVLGMHRSGTSLATSLVRMLDVELGPDEHLIAPATDNPAGFWEHRAFTRLNDEILTTFGGSWRQPPALPAGWERSPALAGLRRRARVAVERDFGAARRWAWKDPRTCFTLPFWRDLVAPTHYLLCLRNPIDVATSLHVRAPETISVADGAELWVTHVEAALRETAGARRLVVFYEDLMRDPKAVLGALGAFVGRPRLASSPAVRKAVRRTVRDDLWHHRTRDDMVVDDDRVPFAAKALYLALRLQRDGELRDAATVETLAAHAMAALDERSHARSCAAELERALAALERAAASREAVKALQEELGVARARTESLETTLETARATIARLETALAAAGATRDGIDEMRRAVGEVAHRIGGQSELLNAISTKVEQTLETGTATRHLAYDALVARFRAAVAAAIPTSATLAVVSRGDDRLLDLGPRRAWHFPRTSDGQYAGHYPASGEDAVEHVESLRAAGAEYLVFPSTALWWLDHYPELRDHLELRYRRVPSEDPSALFSLHPRRNRRGRPLRRLTAALRPGGRGAAAGRQLPAPPRHEGDEPAAAGGGAAQAELSRRLETCCGKAVRSGPLVSIVILNRDGEHHLRRCFAGLRRTRYRSFEVIVVDNGSTDGSLGFLDEMAASLPLRVLRNGTNHSFSQANNQGAGAARGSLLLFLNNDTEPIAPDWLGRLVDTLASHRATVVGARLVYPERPGLDNVGDLDFPDLSLQHRGVHFTAGDGVPRPRNLGCGEDPCSRCAEGVSHVPAVSGACLLVRRDAFEAVAGFDEGYTYGTEDVDLCLRLRERGEAVVYDGRAALWHHEYGTQNAQGRERKRENRIANREVFVGRWGPRIFREVLADRLAGIHSWSEDPVHVAITLTRDDPAAGWGDWYTAHELGDALAGLGWRVTYAERYRDRWYALDPGVDVVIALLDSYELPRAPAHAVKVAWVRNWTNRWLSHPWFDDYDVVLASSKRSQEMIERRSSKVARLLPLATNPARFRPEPQSPDLDTDVVFIGNYWGEHRGVVDALPPLATTVGVRVHGKAWEELPEFRPLHAGPIPYERLPEAYSSARIVIDDTAGPTKPYGAVNSRLFDALSAGAFVLTDNEAGVRELFDADFPVWSDADSLREQVERYLGDPSRRRELAERYRRIVLDEHTYERRAAQIRDLLLEWCLAERAAIRVGIPERGQAERWGDYHFARALQRQLERRGRPTRVTLLSDWDAVHEARADLVVHLFGLSELNPRPGQVNVLWVISHPELVTPELCERYDLVLVASDAFARELAPTVRVPVVCVHQAADPERFRPTAQGPSHELLFVGNSRRVRRRIVDDLTRSGIDFALYGADWTPDLVDPARVRGEHVPNEQAAGFYANAEIVLNDHWDGMRTHGFFSNRLYDALAAGAFVVSDHVDGIDQHFDGGVVTYRTSADLEATIRRYLADPAARRARAARGRAVVLAEHTFSRRADHILELVAPLLAGRARRIDEVPPAVADNRAQAASPARTAAAAAGGR